LTKTTGKDGKSRPTTVKKRKADEVAKQPAADDPAASADQRKQEYAKEDGETISVMEPEKDAVDHVLRLVEQMTAKQRQRLFLLLDAKYSEVTTAAKPAPTSDGDLEIPGFLRRTAQATTQ
jgi:hypothetical protein